MSNTLVLFSGGIDSSLCLKLLLDQDIIPKAMFVDYGQVASNKERDASKRLASHFNITINEIKINTGKSFANGIIKGRNAFLVLAALMYSEFDFGTITLGIHRGTDYKDCSIGFVHQIQELIDFYCNGQVRIDAPLIKFSKDEIWQIAKKRNLPLESTYSCELGLEQPCDKCKSCQDLKELYEL